jgi:DNA-binding phage protein
MSTTTRAGAQRYFESRSSEPGFAEAYETERLKIAQIDRLVRALDDRREAAGISKAELARRADLAPEAIRRLFSIDNPNPTIATLTSIAQALDLEFELVQRPTAEA